ncbi:hypothetical protein [Candidatus Nanohalococcus occultus]|uniref:Uncharacterized protein n=1 Tax=Candidatus Nanohalococcus occultus TaxID=2978047 RepID=A0ABY8CES9_9ARCH|nr:hypothetical protein SVXNc_0204 [Candidatus Nanohaloarchaeota archaeon SVXNc]
MSIIGSILNPYELELDGVYTADEEFLNKFHDGLTEFAEENSYQLENEVYGDTIRWNLEKTKLHYGLSPEIAGNRLSASLDIDEMYDSIKFENESFRASFNHMSSKRFPSSDMKELKRSIRDQL